MHVQYPDDESYTHWFHLECTALWHRFKTTQALDDESDRIGDELVFLCNKCIKEINDGATSHVEDWMQYYVMLINNYQTGSKTQNYIDRKMAYVPKKGLTKKRSNKKKSTMAAEIKEVSHPGTSSSAALPGSGTTENPYGIDIDEEDPVVLKRIFEQLAEHKKQKAKEAAELEKKQKQHAEEAAEWERDGNSLMPCH